MIGKLTGKIENIYKEALILNVHGVGYKVNVSKRLLASSSQENDQVSFFIHTYVREDNISLYGFATLQELSLFENLLSISGIGARIALSVISAGSVEEITKAVLNTDLDFFISISGIGKKSAQRLIMDLKSMLGSEADLDVLEAAKTEYEETIEALKQFGFKVSESRKALQSIKEKRTMTTEDLIKESLRRLSK